MDLSGSSPYSFVFVLKLIPKSPIFRLNHRLQIEQPALEQEQISRDKLWISLKNRRDSLEVWVMCFRAAYTKKVRFRTEMNYFTTDTEDTEI